MTDKAHCGACNQVCDHECYQGVCVCPDLTTPNTNSKCTERPGSGACVDGVTRNVSRVCAPLATSSQVITSASVTSQRYVTKTTTPASITSKSTMSTLSSASTAATQSASTESLYCPPGLPDVCHEGCFNTKTERNHCGGCGRFCSGDCIDGSCFVLSTQPRVQPTSTGRMVLTSSPPIASPMRVAVTTTTELVVVYIMKGLAGPQQA